MFGEFPKLRLDVQSLGLDDERMNEIATIIAEETEAERELTRAKVPDSGPEAGGNNKPMGLLGGSYSYANSLRWDVLLTFGDCAFRCAARARIGAVAVVTFARTHCQPSDQWLLFWYETAFIALAKGVKTEKETAALSKALAEAVQAEFRQRQKERARARYVLDKDGKQAVKAEVEGWWVRWQADPTMYPTAAAFARAMLDKYPDHLTSQPVIEKWVREWREEAARP